MNAHTLLAENSTERRSIRSASALPENCIYDGIVSHERFRPFSHRFEYAVFSVFLDIDALPDTAGRLKLFTYNGNGLFAFFDRDHGPRDGSPLRPWVERELRDNGISTTPARIFIHCFPRFLGYVFNPLSIYFCYDLENRLQAVVYEVKNTFGDQHCYVFATDIPPGQHMIPDHGTNKGFYVSPFIEMACRYDFRMRLPGKKFALRIHQTAEGEDMLLAIQHGRRRVLSDRMLARMMVKIPFLTLKVIAGIHWEALKLWLKGAKFHSRPPEEQSKGSSRV